MTYIKLTDYTTLEAFCEAKQAQNLAEYGRVSEFDTVEYYNEAGVFTLEDAIKWEMYGTISDISKEANGFRARFDWKACSIDELQKDIEYYSKAADETWKRENEMAKEAKTAWKAHLRNLVDMGAKDIRTALKWDMAAEDVEGDLGYYCYHKGLKYSEERLVKRILKAA